MPGIRFVRSLNFLFGIGRKCVARTRNLGDKFVYFSSFSFLLRMQMYKPGYFFMQNRLKRFSKSAVFPFNARLTSLEHSEGSMTILTGFLVSFYLILLLCYIIRTQGPRKFYDCRGAFLVMKSRQLLPYFMAI